MIVKTKSAANDDGIGMSLLSHALDRQAVGLGDRMHHFPGQLSGGQQQRVSIARGLVKNPPLMLCDEPTGDLDRETAAEILGLLQILNREHGKTIVMVTHDPHAASYADNVLFLEDGQIIVKLPKIFPR